MYCYNKAILFDDENEDLIWSKASLQQQIGAYRPAILTLEELLERRPGDPRVTEELANILINVLKEVPRGIEVLQKSLTAQLERDGTYFLFR